MPTQPCYTSVHLNIVYITLHNQNVLFCRALTDIRCSVALLKYYKEKFIISQETAVQTSQEGI